MKRPCIIGGEPTGESGEHIFPAALGGRRTNRGIYCGDHNSAYSPLAAILSSQLKAINAFLGVRGDHSDDPHEFVATDIASGLPIRLSDGKSGFAEPRVLSTSEDANAQRISMAFSDEHQLQEFLEKLSSEGKQYKIESREPPQQFFLSGANVRLLLGGADGLRAVGYVAQTFLAHHFPEAARDSGLAPYKAYTLGQNDAMSVWWDFDLQPDLPRNSFDFGHRVVIGLDAATGLAYGRISLFSALHFATIFGAVPISSSKSVCVDIDPLAEHPPDDIVESRQAAAMAPVSRPTDLTDKLYEPLSDGRAQLLLSDLMSRIASRELVRGAEAIQKKLRNAGQMNVLEREALFNAVIQAEAQRVLNLLRYVAHSLGVGPEELPSRIGNRSVTVFASLPANSRRFGSLFSHRASPGHRCSVECNGAENCGDNAIMDPNKSDTTPVPIALPGERVTEAYQTVRTGDRGAEEKPANAATNARFLSERHALASTLVTLVVGIAWPATVLILIFSAFHHLPDGKSISDFADKHFPSGTVSHLEAAVNTNGFDVKVDLAEQVSKGLSNAPDVAVSLNPSGNTTPTKPLQNVKAISEESVRKITPVSQTKAWPIAKVLWVDPHPANNIGLQYAFESLGILVVTVQDDVGIDPAFRTAGTFDVVISNMTRERTSQTDGARAGWETANLIKAKHPQVPVILYSTIFGDYPVKSLTDPVVLATNVTNDVFQRVVTIASKAH